MGAEDDNPPETSRFEAPLRVADRLGKGLGGDLPCVVCGYNLRGLTVTGSCPECGAAVRAAILALVDPHAPELAPVRRPRVLAVALPLWLAAATVACAVAITPHLMRLVASLADRPSRWTGQDVAPYAIGALALSLLGALTLRRPDAGSSRVQATQATIGLALYVPAGALLWFVLHQDPGRYGFGWTPDTSRQIAQIGLSLCAAALVMLLRPNARRLVTRSLALRTGRVDRQTLAAIALAFVAMGVADTVALVATSFYGRVADGVSMIALLISAFAAVLALVGMIGSVSDSFRIARAIRRPAPGIKQIFPEQGVEQGAGREPEQRGEQGADQGPEP